MILDVPSAPTMLAWVPSDSADLTAIAQPYFDEPGLNWVVGELEAHNARVIAMGGMALALAWIPDPASATVAGVGWVEVVARDPGRDVDTFLAAVGSVPRERGVKITRNVTGPLFDTPQGPGALHEITQVRRRTGAVQHTLRLWVLPEGPEAFGTTLVFQDDADEHGAADALATFVVETTVKRDDAT